MLGSKSCASRLSRLALVLLVTGCSADTAQLANDGALDGFDSDAGDGLATANEPSISRDGSTRGQDLAPPFASIDGGSSTDAGSAPSTRDAESDVSVRPPAMSMSDGGSDRGFVFPTTDTAPSSDDFYRPPPLTGRPGDVIRSRKSPFSVDLFAGAPEPSVMSQQVLYQSTDALGRPIAVSGTVLLPVAAWQGTGSRPLISYAVGTRGLGDACAPSYTLSHGADYEGSIILSLLEQGWAVAVTDYQGSGTPGLHTYMVGPAEGRAVLDMARAAQRLAGTGLSTSNPIGLMGYSQGGGAAGWAAELAATYAPELKLKGSAIGGVPGDLTATAEFLDGGPFVAFALMASLGLDAAYPELDLDKYLNDRGRALVEAGEQSCLASIDGFATLLGETVLTSLDEYVTSNPLRTPAWQARLKEVRLGQAKPSAPIFQYHGLLDEIVPFDQAAALRRTWCDQGVDVTWLVLPVEHAIGIALGPPFAIGWLADRFAGLPTESNCKEP